MERIIAGVDFGESVDFIESLEDLVPNPNAQALGSLGGKARAQKLSPERRKEIAKIASLKATEARKNKDV